MSSAVTTPPIHSRPDDLAERYRVIRSTTNALCEPLSAEDMTVQAVEETSPAKWHLAHTTWFFETFVLERHEPGFVPFNPDFRVLFNSYYQLVGERHPRPARGMLTRPGLGEVMAYRDTIDERVIALLRAASPETAEAVAPLLTLGLNHEQQHQELLLMDVKRLLHTNPTRPAYAVDAAPAAEPSEPAPRAWIDVDGGVVGVGHDPADGFAFDNETPRHRRLIEPFQIASRPATNAEFLAFIEDGGYRRPELWLDEGWSAVLAECWELPIYWHRSDDGSWLEYTLAGLRPLDPAGTLVHVSFFEAEAFARWSGARLPTEAEWEAAAAPRWRDALAAGDFLDEHRLHLHPAPPAADDPTRITDLAGGVWEWTRSAHEPYPGYTPPAGAVGEYNGKFMCGSFVLRGGSCVTPRDHVRPTYRNFFRPGARWAFAGVRLARGGAPAGGHIPAEHGSVKRANLRRTVRPGADTEAFARDIAEGLSRPPGRKSSPPKHLYDERGSELFTKIAAMPTYYPARVESAIIAEAGPAIARAVGPQPVLIEPGAGDAAKARSLLRFLESPRMFVPVEISDAALEAGAERVAVEFPEVLVRPVCANFFDGLAALPPAPGENRLVFFPGSTIGNTERPERIRLLRTFARAAGADGRVLIGFDMAKDPGVLLPAYDDPEGVSAAFALNLIARLNRELDAGLDPDAFRYEAVWQPEPSRIRMSLVCERDQRARIGDRTIELTAGEDILTEHSYKFTPEMIESEAAEAGLRPVRTWTDADRWFSLVLFEPAGEAADA